MLNRKRNNHLKPVFTGVQHLDEIFIQLFKYNKDDLTEDPNYSEKKFKGFSDNEYQYWLNIHGIHDVEFVKDICLKLGVHSLVIQDILDINQRPKFQKFDDYCFFTIKSIIPSQNSGIESEQLSFILGKNYLISFQEKKADYFDHVRYRLREKIGVSRERKTDFLLYLLLESILDNYFKTVENIEKQVDDFGVIDTNTDPSPQILKDMELYKRQLHIIKRTLLPIKEMVTTIEREQFKFFDSINMKYYFELKDLCLTLLDSCDIIEMRLESSINLFFSVQGHRMNQVMKILTIVATIFIPLTFIAGIYGMNFNNMPELSWKWGYFGVWFIIIVVFLIMLIYFRRKKWF
ncbi:magnesium/cobalt transporter CorA [Bacteroidota bacterium]